MSIFYEKFLFCVSPDMNENIEEKLKEVKEFIEQVADRIAQNPDNCYWAYKTIVCSAIENFFNHLFNSPDNDIDWEDPGLDLHYDVNIDENLNRVDFLVSENNVKDEETYNKKLASIFVRLHNFLLLDALSKNTIAIKQNEKYKYLINSQKIENEIERIYNRYEKSKKIIDLTHHKLNFPFHLKKLDNEKVLAQRLSGKLTVEFAPLTIDKEKYTSYYSISVYLTLSQSLNSYCVEEKKEILQRIRESARHQILYEDKTPDSEEIQYLEFQEAPEDFVEMGFTGKLLIDKSLAPDFIGANTLKISINNRPAQEKPQKKLTFDRPRVKLTEDEEKFLYLYAIKGVKNYREIAKLMFCSEQTVKNWAQNIQSKLRANNMSHAVYLYFAPND